MSGKSETIGRAWLATQLVFACGLLGLGVGMVLTAGLGSDGYSSLVNGIARATDVPYAAINWGVGFTFVVLAWSRGVRPGPGTITHPIVVGLTVNAVLVQMPTPEALLGRLLLLGIGVIVLATGVATYLEAGLGAGPFEAATMALHPVSFRLGYGVLQATGALLGWALGASFGAGTLVVIVGVGPIVTALRRHLKRVPLPSSRPTWYQGKRG